MRPRLSLWQFRAGVTSLFGGVRHVVLREPFGEIYGGDPLSSALFTREKEGRSLQRVLAACLAMILAVVGFIVASPAAFADDEDDIRIDVLYNGQALENGDEVPEGVDLLYRVQYDAEADIDGKEIVLKLPEHVITAPELPDGNEAIESITRNDDGTITIKFKDVIPSGTSDGALALNLKVLEVTETTTGTINWTIGEENTDLSLEIIHEEEPPVTVQDGYDKRVDVGNLSSFVKVVQNEDGNYIFDGFKDGFDDQELTYTLVLKSSEAREEYSITDQLPTGLEYVEDSFSGSLKTYNPEATEDFPFDPEIEGKSFTGTVDVPANSELTITYTATITDIADLKEQLQDQWENLNGAPGNFSINLKNTATFGEDGTRDATVGISGNVPGVGVGGAFAKSGNWNQLEVIAEDGVLEEPAVMEYTLTADLTQWDERNPNFTLNQNVVISDTLIAQAEWLTDEDDFITAEGIELTRVDDCTDAAAFAGGDYVGKWCVNGQTLLVNVGKDKSTKPAITVKAQLNTVEGLTEAGDTTILGATSYRWPNTAQFNYAPGQTVTKDYDGYPIVLPDDREGGLNDSAAFRKVGPEGDVRGGQNEAQELKYNFVVDTAKAGVDKGNFKIVDEVNAEFFETENLADSPVAGTYDGQPLSQDAFELTVTSEGFLEITLSAAGKETVAANPGKTLNIELTLTTVVLEGKTTLEIENKATLYGSDEEADYWSEHQSEVTSYGDEAELRKRVYDDANNGWVADLNAEIRNGEYVNDAFIYSVEVIPRGNYGNAFPVEINPRTDDLPDNVDFYGFVQVDENGAPLLDEPEFTDQQMNGNILATYSEGENTVAIQQAPGTSLNPNDGRIIVYYAVKPTSTEEDIVNTIAGSSTTIHPYGDPSIDIEKWNDEGEAPEYNEAGKLQNDGFDGDFDEAPGKALAANKELPINFTISNDGREDLIDVKVSDELIDGVGEITDLECVFPDESTGTEWDGPLEIGAQFECSGTLPALTNGESHFDTAKVVGTGIYSGTDVEDEDDWQGFVHSPSVNIEKWTDEGEAPEYDETGALLNDGYDGDFDSAPGKELKPGKDQKLNFTVSNDGTEPLISLAVSDKLIDGVGTATDLECVFPDGSKGTTWDGPFEVGAQFDCSATLPALGYDKVHFDTASVTAIGLYSGTGVEDSDDWHGHTPEEVIVPGILGKAAGLAATGSNSGPFIGLAALLLLIGGAATMIATRRNASEA